MIRITQAPAQPVQVLERFTLVGTASPTYAGRTLTLTVDNQYQATGPKVEADGSWRVEFLFQQAGSRRMKLSIGSDSAEVSVQVTPVMRLRFTTIPQAVQTGRSVTFAGDANGYADGTQLLLRAEQRFELARPKVQSGHWQAPVIFGQAGRRTIELLGNGQDRAETAIEVAEAPPRPARLRFTTLPSRIETAQTVVIAGAADGYKDGDQLLLRIDQTYAIAQPLVQAGRWQAAIVFQNAGKRLVEIIGSEQDQARVEVNVLAAPPKPPRTPRVSFTNVPQQIRTLERITLSGRAEDYNNGDELVVRADQRIELGRPRVQNQTWQLPVVFNQAGKRLIEIIGSEQDRAQITLTVQPLPGADVQILPRNTWTDQPTPADVSDLQPLRITIHHTFIEPTPATSATQAQDADRMQTIWNSHVIGNGWSDIGYHYVIMPSGRVFEGRAERKRGAHDVVNDGLGIAFDGVYTDATINQRQFDVAVALCTLLCRRYNITDPVTPVPTPTADYGTRNLPLICGHRDRVATECPGSEAGRTVRLPDIRQTVKTRL